VGQVLLVLEASRLHSVTHKFCRTYVDECSVQRPLPDNTQHAKETDIHTPGGKRTHSSSKRVAADLRLKAGDHWDQRTKYTSL